MQPKAAGPAGSPRSRRVLTEEQIASVHRASLEVLEQVGILIEHNKALSLLAEAGAVTAAGSRLVKIPARLVEEALATVPSEFRIGGGRSSRDLRLAHDSPPRGRPVISLDWIVDHGRKERRQVTVKDLEAWVKVANALPNLSLVSGLYPWDVPLQSRDVRAAEAMLKFSDKPILMAPFSGWSVDWIVRMLSALPDLRVPRVIVFSSCNSPLIYSDGQMDALLKGVEHDLPVMVNSSAVTGVTAPVTLAGTLVMMNAEILAGITVAQLAKPGASVIYCGHPVMLDMKTSIASCGHTEAGLLAAALIDLGRSYRCPAASNGLTTDSHVCDEQAAIEKLITGELAVLSGAALNGGAGSLAAVGTASLEQLVIDDDIYDRLFRIQEGIAVDDGTLALEVIRAVGPSRHFLEELHTRQYLRSEFRRSKLANRLDPEIWLKRGGRDIAELAAERVRTILKEAAEPLLEPKLVAELGGLAGKAEREGG